MRPCGRSGGAAWAATETADLFSPPSYTTLALGAVPEKQDDGPDKLRAACNMMRFGQILSGGYSKYDMSKMPDAASAVKRASDTAADAADIGKALGKCLDKNGRLKPDLEDAKASAVATFVLAEQLVIESYTALRLLRDGGRGHGGGGDGGEDAYMSPGEQALRMIQDDGSGGSDGEGGGGGATSKKRNAAGAD